MIEEIDSTTYNKHYFEKVYKEAGSDPHAFLAAALDFLKQETSFFAQPEAAAAAVHRALASHLPAGMAGPGAAPAAAAAVATPPAAEQVALPPAEQQVPAAVAEQPAAAAQEKEAEEAAAEASTIRPNDGNGADMGPYCWTQTLGEVVITVPMPAGTKGRACDVSIGRDKLRVGLKGQAPVLDGPLFASVKPDDCLWNLVDGLQLEITLAKRNEMEWWRCVVKGEPEIDTQAVEPEASKLTDLDPEMRATVEKMMYDQRQKAMGRPTSDEQSKADIMQTFMKSHPEMDFSNAKIDM